MLADLEVSVARGGSRGELSTENWALVWRFRERRIEDKTRENVFTIHSVHLAKNHQRQGLLTELLRHLDECPTLAGRAINWIYLEQVNFRLANHLERELHYQSDFGMVIDCWRRTTGQLEMRL